jgi:hypothetical protein
MLQGILWLFDDPFSDLLLAVCVPKTLSELMT